MSSTTPQIGSTFSWPRLCGTLALAGGGGAVFAWLGVPLAWMLGAMLSITVASLAGAPTVMAQPLRRVMIAILGIMLGSAFTPEILSDAQKWWPAVITMLLFVSVGTAACYVYFRKIAKFDPTTAYFSSAPGGLSEMALVGESYGGNVAAISLVHTTRILIVVGTIPVYFRYVQGWDVPPSPIDNGVALQWLDIVLLTGCAVVGVPLADKLKVPAGALVGPMILSAALHIAGLTHAAPPALIVAIAQIVMGAGIGCRFSGLSLSRVGTIILAGAGSGLLLVTGAALTAIYFATAAGQTSEALLLALAPGGLAEMSLIALVIGSQTAFISLMHMLRIVFVVLIVPSLFRLFAGQSLTGEDAIPSPEKPNESPGD